MSSAKSDRTECQVAQIELALQKTWHRQLLAQQPALDALIASERQALEVAQQTSTPLAGVTVLCTGFSGDSVKQHARQLVVRLGAVLTCSYTPRLRADVLVAQFVLDANYQVAVPAGLPCTALLKVFVPESNSATRVYCRQQSQHSH